MPSDTTESSSFHLLCKASYPAEVSINGKAVKQYQTGIFFDEIQLQEGANTFVVQAVFPDASKAQYEHTITYIPKANNRQPYPLWIDNSSIEPATDQALLADDLIRLRFQGSKGQQAQALIRPGNIRLPFSREDHSDYSLYQADLPLSLLKPGKAYRITLELDATGPAHKGEKARASLSAQLSRKQRHEFPLLRIVEDKAALTYNLGPIRLGGPIINELPVGVVLQASGKVGEYYRIRLDEREEGYIHESQVEALPEGTVRPGYYLQSVQARPGENADEVRIPWPEPAPFAIIPLPEENKILINLYGVKTSSTWMVHHKGLSNIERVDWRQLSPETYQLILHLNSSRIWGYTMEPGEGILTFRLKHPPKLEPGSLKGLKVSIEAGHGGSNTGAVGLSGLLEKDVNLDVALRLEKLCQEAGIKVLQVRPEDIDMGLEEKRALVEASDADLHISIHANSGGVNRGYLGVSGVSTYYYNPFWAEFAEVMYGQLLPLGLKEFGVVGSFNYRVTRLSSRPAILVEQAFLSQAEDEEKLASEAFRQRMAEGIFQGIVQYVSR